MEVCLNAKKNKIYLAFQGGFVSFWEVAVVEVWFLTLENVSMVKDSEVPSWFIQWNLLSWTELSSMSFFLIVFRDFGFGGMDWFVLCRLREERCSSFQWNGDSTFSPGVCTTVWVGGAVERVREQREREIISNEDDICHM